MKFGVREITDVVFKANTDIKIGNSTFKKGQPVLYIDTAKTSNLEESATTVYATGGRGNTRLIAWEGEKTLTFNVEDALLSPLGFAVLSGAGLLKGTDSELVHVHTTSQAFVSNSGVIDLTNNLGANESIDATAPVFVLETEEDGSLKNVVLENLTVSGKTITGVTSEYYGKPVFVDFYITKNAAKVSELQIDAKHFAGYYYVEASTLFRDQSTGKDMPVEITLPNVKIQSNFTFSMASTGDPSTFTFTMDAFPGYTAFNKVKKVLMTMQIIEDTISDNETAATVMGHPAGFEITSSKNDSTAAFGESI